MSNRERVEALAGLAVALRVSVKVGYIGPNSRDIIEHGGSVWLTPSEAEEAAQRLLDSPAMRDLLAEAKAEALREAADRLQADTEGSDRRGTETWPAPDRAIYSLAIEEAQGVLRDRAASITRGDAR